MSQVCKNCLMDNTDPLITFNEKGICNHCQEYKELNEKFGYNPNKSPEQLKTIVEKMKKTGRGKEYDCVIGISGGVDSSYLLHVAHGLGLRILAVHVDAGWNTDTAVNNIHKICNKLGIVLHTIIIDWPTMKELQRAYMFSGLPNLDIPQDHAFIAAVYKYTLKHKIKYMLNGSNLATEGILPNSWGYANTDFVSIKSVYKKHRRTGSKRSLRKYPHFGILKYVYYTRTVERIKLLNLIPYTKKDAIKTLSEKYDWVYYGGKHFESRFTKFFQSHYLPVKYGYDKRLAHLSSLIVGGEMSREDAMKEFNNPNFYPIETMEDDRDYILKKLDITLSEWEKIMSAPNKSEDNYKSNKRRVHLIKKINNLRNRIFKT